MLTPDQIIALGHSAAVRSLPQTDLCFPKAYYYKFLYALVGLIQPKLSVELGVCTGGGSYHLATGWPFGQVVGVDLVNDYPDQITFLQNHLSNFDFIQADSIQAAAEIFDSYGPIDILFIDTDHNYIQVMAEYIAYTNYLLPDAVIILDDILNDQVNRAWQQLPGQKTELNFLHPGAGFGVILLNGL